MNRTKIEWVKNPDGTQGYTWNPISGCLNHINGMCKGGNFPCYAYKLANTRLFSIYCGNINLAAGAKGSYESRGNSIGNLTGDYTDPFYPRFWEDRIWDLRPKGLYDKAWNRDNRRWGSEKGIFVCDMSDLFGIGIPDKWTSRVLDEIRIYQQHRFYLLTKQPQNLIKFSPFPDNCWVGVTATGYKEYVDALAYLVGIKADVKYISFEPLLSWDRVITNNFAYSKDLGHAFKDNQLLEEAGISWVIIGSQTKPYKPPKIEWVEEIVEACNHASIPVFIKNNLKPFLDRVPTRIIYQYGSGKLRQEMPK